MGYVFDFNDALAYEHWEKHVRTQPEAELENRLMVDMLKPLRGESLLDIGCGTGTSLLPFLDLGLEATGLDASPYMLDIALKNLKNRVALYRGVAEDLPFEDNSFNHSIMVTTLEFVDDPYKALEEACRVTKDRLFLGVLNRYAIKGFERRLKGIFSHTIYNHAKFFSIWELKQMILGIAGDVPIAWRTIYQLPSMSGRLTQNLEQSSFVQKCPFGAFMGVVATLVPRFRTKPLTVRYRAKQPTGALTG
jgi:ubiquinone/menaquinone biosynthesis C-methylase UbiE